MEPFDVELDIANNSITVTHREQRHVYFFMIIPEPPYLSRGSIDRIDQQASHDAGEFFQAATQAAEKAARAKGLIP
jgi:tRNA1(Val) A37 N6-methylase TrmN6